VLFALAIICGAYQGGEVCVHWKAQRPVSTRAECIALAQEKLKLGKNAFWYASVSGPHRVTIRCLKKEK
jgi:hypothetical protein